MLLRKLLAALLVLILIGAAGFAALAWRSEIDPVQQIAATDLKPEAVAHGAELATIGNCNVCHTAKGGEVFAGGLPLPTPFGTVYSTNITPDPDTGIGRWSEAAFLRAMREGVDREGHHLYPAFPYDHFTLVTDEDVGSIYAFLMTRRPVRATAPANGLPFPLNVRPILAGWKLLFLHKGPYVADAAQSPEWNRGRYLAEGLAHCGACHTPRNRFGAERRDARFGGGEAEGWNAYPINAASPAPVPWDADALTAFLRQGWHPVHGTARGPMSPVTTDLGSVPEADARAIAVYVASVMGEPSAERKAQGEALLRGLEPADTGSVPSSGDSLTVPNPGDVPQGDAKAAGGGSAGEAIYVGACSACHDSGRPLPFGGLHLALSTAVHASNPKNIANVVFAGLAQSPGESSAVMPGFAGALSDEQTVELLTYLRARFTDFPPWDDLPAIVRQARADIPGLTRHPTPGNQAAPADTSPKVTQ